MLPSTLQQDSHAGPTIIDIRSSSVGRSRSDDESDSSSGSGQLTASAKNKRTKTVHNPHGEDLGHSLPSPEGSANDSDEEASTADESLFDLPKMILDGLTKPAGQEKTIPTLVLYDDRGLQLFDEITYLEEYYLTNEEIDVLTKDIDRIIEHIPDNSVVVELGAGSLRKTVLLLNALEKKRKNIRYYALDLMVDELTKSLKSLGRFTNVTTAGLWGTYDEGLKFLDSFPNEIPKTILWLGSSVGNLHRDEARDFLTSYHGMLNVGDTFLVGVDRRNDPKEITVAYNDSKGVTREFVMNGLDHINVILGQSFIDRANFEYFARYNEVAGRHEAYYRVRQAHQLTYLCSKSGEKTVIDLAEGELINVEYSYKWSLEESAQLFDDASFTRIGQYTSTSRRYDLHMLRKAAFHFSTFAPQSPLPSAAEWTQLWKAWDTVTLDMIQHPKMLLEKPIDLRHPFIFYLGHIPVFMDLQLSRVLGESPLEPAYFGTIFERGIDPDVDDPTQCHQHSEVPDQWPDIKDILDFRDRTRQRMLHVIQDRTQYPLTRRLARVIFMAFEHEAMHLETLLYMLVQSPNTRPPPSMRAPWLSESGSKKPVGEPQGLAPATWIKVTPTELDPEMLTLGHHDDESRDLTSHGKGDLTSPFGWDNESPRIQLEEGVSMPKPYKIQSRQVTNGEYFQYLRATGLLHHSSTSLPASWILKAQDEVFVRSVYGPVPLHAAYNWPVSCSYVQAGGYVQWLQSTLPAGSKKLSLPTEAELSIVFKVKQAKDGLRNDTFGLRHWYPVMSEALLLQESSSSSSTTASQTDVTTWLQGPGALWDWTSTVFAPLCKDPADFSKSKLYPGYSSDFFDGKHMVVLGASWATHPRMALRRSYRNWYQANYPFVFAGFRLVERM
ncbi:hypothetical protein DFQ27_006251 [Actinomortierella ambigua]|uniref:DUF323 domain-containing protein n=1 Tax=Actinomortierella ambigua TaxID=1343610 RepID=A0A9P6UC24_9FUNG|nr:hypothetical protein DFQ27_006251 [Actinomortierella ambigua]